MNKWTETDKECAEAFSRTAQEFCSFLDKHRDFDNPRFLRECHRLVSKLHSQALGLPEAEDLSEDNPEANVLAHANVLYDEIGARLGPRDAFWVVFNPYEKEDPVQTTISDGLRGIYLEMKDGFAAFDSGSIQDAAWSWKFGHRSFWGRKAAETLMALQDLAQGDYHVG